MARLIQSVEFFVVGGVVQADRSCYIERSADQDLINAVTGQRFAWILSPRGTGKTSLMLRASATLRAGAQHTAVVDVRQIASHDEGADPSRWFYGVAHRICRELRLKFDIQAWWQERSALNAEQRFAEFFAKVVLAHTDQTVTIFFDEIEHVAELPFAADFFEVVRNCYALRASEPDYRRLNFVVLGSGAHTRLCPDAAISPFVIGEEIVLRDFTLEEASQLEPGFELGEEAALGLIERIYAWTSGQPYLTQKLARAVARRGGRLEDVERCAQELFVSTNAARSEPQLSFAGTSLTSRGPSLRTALLVLRRLGQGLVVAHDPSSRAQERLLVAGIARRDTDGNLAIANRIYARVFDERWARASMPFNWRGLSLGVAVAALLVLVPYWYVNYLPRPWIQTLTSQEAEFEQAQTAWARLARLPGFAARADSLFAEVLAKRAESLSSLADITENDALVRGLRGYEALADELLARFWLRRCAAATNMENRDAALLYATQALTGLPEQAERVIAELGGDDYARLSRTVNLSEQPVLWSASDEFESMAVVDANAQARFMRLADGGVRGNALALQLTALQHTAFVRELSVDSEGSAGSFELQLVVDHPSAEDLTATLAAPSGASVTVALSDAHRDSDGFRLDARALGNLADERRQGVWRLTLVDTVAGSAGVMHRWSLEFADGSESWRGAPDAGVPIPEPQRTTEVDVVLSGDGRIAVARPALEGVSGSLAVWSLERQALLADLRIDRPVTAFELTRDGSHLLAESGNELIIWSVAADEIVARIQTQTQFLLPPALSTDGGYVMIAERVDQSAPLFSLIRIADGQLVSSITGEAGPTDWVLGPEARYLALLNDSRAVEIIEPRRGAAVATLDLARPLVRTVTVDHGELLLTVDADGAVQVWQFSAEESGIALTDSWDLGVTAAPASLGVSQDASTAAFIARAGELVVHDLGRQRPPWLLRVVPAQTSVATRFVADGSAVMTQAGRVVRTWDIAERPLAPGAAAQLTALAAGRHGRLAAVGYAGGFVRAASLSDLSVLDDARTIDYIGHRGPVTAITMNVEQNLVASGGRDGSARLWNLATMSPGDSAMNHAEGPVTSLALSDDAQFLLVGTPDTASLWQLPEQQLAATLPVNGMPRALTFARDASLFAIGDSTGNLFVAVPQADAPLLSARADSAITTLAFSPAADYVVSGDTLGNLRVWSLHQRAVPAGWRFAEPIRWMAFGDSSDSDASPQLFVQTEQWLHELALGATTEVIRSALLPAGLSPGAAADDTGRWQLLGGLTVGRMKVATIELAAPDDIMSSDSRAPQQTRSDAANLWSAKLGLQLDGDGIAVPVIH